MSTKIGFHFDEKNLEREIIIPEVITNDQIMRPSLVEVKFPNVNKTYSYYNDLFSLNIGDFVFVDGKLEGVMGIVVNITYNFKIKLSDYRCIIGKADTNVQGEFHFAGSHFITFDSNALTLDKAITWFKAKTEDEEYVSSTDGTSFILNTLEGLNFNEDDLGNGHEIYMKNDVKYLELNGTKGRAIVKTSKPYIVEFTYKNGEISKLYCECFHFTPCKHCFATLLQLRESLKNIDTNYSAEYEKNNYFATIFNDKFFTFVVNGKSTGSIYLK